MPLAAIMVAVLVGAVPAAAQVAGSAPAPAASAPAGPTPAASATAVPVPPPPVIVVPEASPTAAKPAPSPSATPRPKPTPAATPSPTPRAEPTATPRPAPSESAIPAVKASPAPQPVPVATPAPPAATALADYWPVALGVAILLLALGWVLLRRRRAARRDEYDEAAVVDDALPADPASGRARLTLAFRPIRAGLNLLSATSENEIIVTNIGDALADDIRLVSRLISAHTGQDVELAALYAAPIGRPVTPAFSLAPGEQRAVTAIAALPRDAIRTLNAGGRPMFVPIVAVNLTYAAGGAEAQLAQAFAVGVERVDSTKLAPFWLDAPPRTYDQVAARPHAAALER